MYYAAKLYKDKVHFVRQLALAHEQLASYDVRARLPDAQHIEECWMLYNEIRDNSTSKVLGRLHEVIDPEICQNFGLAFGLDDSSLLGFAHDEALTVEQQQRYWQETTCAIARGKSSEIGASYELARRSMPTPPPESPRSHSPFTGAGGVLATKRWSILLNMLFLLATAHKIDDVDNQQALCTIYFATHKSFSKIMLHKELMQRAWNSDENEITVTGIEIIGLYKLLGYRLITHLSGSGECISIQFEPDDIVAAKSATLSAFVNELRHYKKDKANISKTIWNMINSAATQTYLSEFEQRPVRRKSSDIPTTIDSPKPVRRGTVMFQR